MVTSDSYAQLYFNKLDNLDKINKFLETCKQTKLIKEQIENLNSAINLRGLYQYFRKLQQREAQSRWLAGEFHQTFLKN